MDEKFLLKLSLICSLIGILALFFLSEHIDLDESSVDRINELGEGTDVKIRGFIENVKDLDKIAILEVSQIKSVPVVLFKSGNITINHGDYVEITGTVEEYEGKMELIGNQIKRLD